MRYRPVKKPAPMPENPYHRIFTPMPSFEDLVRKAREEEKKLKNNKNGILKILFRRRVRGRDVCRCFRWSYHTL